MKTEQQSNNAGSDNLTARRSLVTGVGVAVAGLAAGAVSPRAEAQSRRRRDDFEPARHELDAWLGEASGSHRIFVDSASTQGGTDAVLYATNVFNAHINAYAGQASDLAVVICFRHLSTPFGFGNATWEKYGAAIQRVLQSQCNGIEQGMACRGYLQHTHVVKGGLPGIELRICPHGRQLRRADTVIDLAGA